MEYNTWELSQSLNGGIPKEFVDQWEAANPWKKGKDIEDFVFPQDLEEFRERDMF